MPLGKPCRESGCGHEMPLSMQHCPHCGRPRRFPNVDLAEDPPEKAALDRRYFAALDRAKGRGTQDRVDAFELYVEQAHAVTACPFAEVRRIAKSDKELSRTFYMKGVTNLDKGSHVLAGKEWDAIRPTAETAFFGDENKRYVHFAALSPTDEGLHNYGECSVTFRPSMVTHRTSVLEENMLVFFKTRCADYWKTERIPPGYRSNWTDRAKVAVAKLADRFQTSTTDAEFSAFLLTTGPTSADDRFVELQIFGDVTVRTIEKVVLTRPLKDVKRSIRRAVEFDLQQHGVTWEDRTTTRS